MLQYPTPDDLHYPHVPDTDSQWGPPRPDTDEDDRQRAQQQRAPTNYTSATAYTSRDPYPAQAQSHCSGTYAYPSQQYTSPVNYVQPPYDFAAYPVSRVVLG